MAGEPGAGIRSVSRIDVGEIETWSHSDVGRVRSINQDRCGEFAARGTRLLVVADGLGGHAGGEHASRIAVETIGSVFEKDDSKPEEFLRRAFAAANASILRESLQNAELSGMGTPDLLGSYGMFSLYTDNPNQDISSVSGGQIYLVDVEDRRERRPSEIEAKAVGRLLRVHRSIVHEACGGPHLHKALGAIKGVAR